MYMCTYIIHVVCVHVRSTRIYTYIIMYVRNCCYRTVYCGFATTVDWLLVDWLCTFIYIFSTTNYKLFCLLVSVLHHVYLDMYIPGTCVESFLLKLRHVLVCTPFGSWQGTIAR